VNTIYVVYTLSLFATFVILNNNSVHISSIYTSRESFVLSLCLFECVINNYGDYVAMYWIEGTTVFYRTITTQIESLELYSMHVRSICAQLTL